MSALAYRLQQARTEFALVRAGERLTDRMPTLLDRAGLEQVDLMKVDIEGGGRDDLVYFARP